MDFIQKNELVSPISNIETNEHPNIDKENVNLAFQRTYKEHHKDLSYDSLKKKNFCNILSNIKKYCCNVNHVDSIRFNEKYVNFLGQEDTTMDADSFKDKLEDKSYDSNFLCIGSSNDEYQLNHKDDIEYLKLTSEFKKGHKDLYGRSYEKNKIRNLGYSFGNPPVIDENCFFDQNVPFIHNEIRIPNQKFIKNNLRKIYKEKEAKQLGISNINETENIKPHAYINKKYVNNEKLENSSNQTLLENLKSNKYRKKECFRNNKMNNKKIYEEEERNVNRKRNTNNEKTYIYNLIKGSNNYTSKDKNDTQNEIILNKYKTLLHINNRENAEKKSEQVLKNSFSSHDKYIENKINSPCPSSNKRDQRKRVNLNIELLNIDKNINLMISNEASIDEKNNKNLNYSTTPLSNLEKKEKPLHVDNFSQTVKKKKFIKIRRFKIRRKVKKKKNFKLKKKIPNKNELVLKKKKPLKSRRIKNRNSNKNPKKNVSRNKKKNNKRIEWNHLYRKNKKKYNLSAPHSDICSKKLVNIKLNKDILSKVMKIESRLLNFNVSNDDSTSKYSTYKNNNYSNIEEYDDKNSKADERKIKGYSVELDDKVHNSMSKSLENVKIDNLKKYGINNGSSEQKLNDIRQVNTNKGAKDSNILNSCIDNILTKNVTCSIESFNLNNKKNIPSYEVITFEHKNSELINFKENFTNSHDKNLNFNEVNVTNTITNSQNKECNCNNSIKNNTNIKLEGNDLEFLNTAQKQVENVTNFKPPNEVNLISNKKKLHNIENKINSNSLVDENKRENYENDYEDTLMILQNVATILNDEKENMHAYYLDEEDGNKINLTCNMNLNKVLSENFKFPGCEKYKFFWNEIKKKCKRSKSHDSFFIEKSFHKNTEYMELIKTFLSKKKNSKDKNNLLFQMNLLQQRSLFKKQMDYENDIGYILNSIVFYSNKLKNMLNHSIKRRNRNEYILEVKFFILCLIYLIEKHKKDTFSVSIEIVSKLVSEIIEKIRYYILELPLVIEITKFESVIIKIYFIELLKMSKLLCSIYQKKLEGKYFSYSSSVTNDIILRDNVAMQDVFINLIPIKKEKDILNNLNKELSDKKNLQIRSLSMCEKKKTNNLFEKEKNEINKPIRKKSEKDENMNLKGNHLDENKYNEKDLKEVYAISNNANEIKNIKNNFNLVENNEKDSNERKNNSSMVIRALIKKLKKDILNLLLKKHNKAYNLILFMNYLDRLSYIYKINNSIFFYGENEKNIMKETKEILENMNEKILREENEAFDVETLISIKEMKKKLENYVFKILNTFCEKNEYSYKNVSRHKNAEYIERTFSLLKRKGFNKKNDEEKIIIKENNSLNPKNCLDKIKFMCCNNEEKELSKKNNYCNIDETKELQELNDCLNFIILKKNEEIFKNPNDYYNFLKEYNQELSLINELQSDNNTLVNDFLDDMNIYKFSKFLNFYVKKKYFSNNLIKRQSINNSKVYHRSNGILEIIYDLYLENEKNVFETKQYKSFYKNIHYIDNINKNMFYSFIDDQFLDDSKYQPYGTNRSYNGIKFSKSKSMNFYENDNQIKYFKIYS